MFKASETGRISPENLAIARQEMSEENTNRNLNAALAPLSGVRTIASI